MSAKTDRRSRQGIESRQRILDATFEIAQELGYQGTSIAKVSARCALPASSIYWHFADKDTLFDEVIKDSFDRWNASMPKWDPPQPGQSTAEVVSARVRRAIDSIATNPEFWRLGLMLSLERQVVEPAAKQRFIAIRRSVLNGMATFWRAVLGELGVDHVDQRAELLARFAMATADGVFVSAQVDESYGRAPLARLLAESLNGAVERWA